MDKKSMHGASHVTLRNGVFQFSRRVPRSIFDGIKELPPFAREKLPTDLRNYFSNQFVRFSLKTGDKAEAKRLGTTADFEFETKAKRMQDWLSRPENQFDVIEPSVIRAIVQRWVSQELKDDEAKRLNPANAFDLRHHEKGLYMMEPDFQMALAVDGAHLRDPVANSTAEDLEKQYGLKLDPNGPTFALLHREVLLGYLSIYDAIKRRNAGKDAPTPGAPQIEMSDVNPMLQQAANGASGVVHSAKGNGLENSEGVKSIGEVMDDYLKDLTENKFKRKVRRCLQLFGEVIGRDTPITEVRQLHVTRYLRELCKLPVDWARRFDKGESVQSMMDSEDDEICMSPSTWEQNYKFPLGTFFENSMRDYGDFGFRNLTVKGIEYPGDREYDENKQRALSIAELQHLLEGDEFRKIANDPEKEALYWLSIVPFFTGARPRELCQINPQVDFGKMEGHWYIDISEYSAAGVGVVKTVKMGEERRLPLHRKLVSLGFHKYIERIMKNGADRLFPKSPVKGGNPFSVLGGEFTEVLKAVNLYDDTAPPGRRVLGIYVARKSFITHARAQGVISKEITGHADDGTTNMQRKHYITEPEPFLYKVGELSKFDLPLEMPLRVDAT